MEIENKYSKIAISDTNTNTLHLFPYDDFKNYIKNYIKKKWHRYTRIME